ncbi:MAG: hypothetical protein ACRDSR_09690 [Pseudonocardiaceae bacterium]
MPIDRMGQLTEEDEKILKKEKVNPVRRKELVDRADAGYGEFGEAGGETRAQVPMTCGSSQRR